MLLLDAPAARQIVRGEARLLLLDEVEAVLASPALVVDACRYVVRDPHTVVSLARRPVLFTLARALAEAWPADVPRDVLIARAFRTHVNPHIDLQTFIWTHPPGRQWLPASTKACGTN